MRGYATTPERTAEILALIRAGRTQVEIVATLGVPTRTVARVLARHRSGLPAPPPRNRPKEFRRCRECGGKFAGARCYMCLMQSVRPDATIPSDLLPPFISSADARKTICNATEVTGMIREYTTAQIAVYLD